MTPYTHTVARYYDSQFSIFNELTNEFFSINDPEVLA